MTFGVIPHNLLHQIARLAGTGRMGGGKIFVMPALRGGAWDGGG